MKRSPKSPKRSLRKSPKTSPKSPRRSPRNSPKSPRYSKVDRALKDAGIPMNVRDTIYNFGTDSIYQYMLDNVIVDPKDKSTWKFDEKRFVAFVKKNYFKSKTLKLVEMKDFNIFIFEDEKENIYKIEIKEHKFQRFRGQERNFLDITSYKNRKYYRDYDKPASESYKNGKLDQFIWYKDFEKHRDNDKPAVVNADGTLEWYQDGYRHREGGKPAIIWPDGKKEWYKYGQRFREDNKPHIEYPNGKKEWYHVLNEYQDELVRTEEP